MSHKAGRKTKVVFDTDQVMKMTWKTLVRDFRSVLEDPFFLQDAEMALNGSIQRLREFVYPNRMLQPYKKHKAEYQMENLFKRYIFADDKYTQQELTEKTYDKFYETQLRIGVPREFSYRSKLVLQLARKHCKEILGDFNEEEHVEHCKFGIRAAAGVRLKESFLDERFRGPVSGSREHLAWFKAVLESDDLLSRSIYEQQDDLRKEMDPEGLLKKYNLDRRIITNEVIGLRWTAVPKSWKAGRFILPNTNVGGFYSYGLGRMIGKRLASVGLHLKTLQGVHRRWVKRISRTRSHVTADLSSASDSFTRQLVMMLLPRKWWNVIKYGRITSMENNGELVHLTSFMTMGIGFTFELQSLLFYSILLAIQELAGLKGRISVYGDDLIYPIKMHPYVSAVFNDLGLILNMEKTYVKEEFRESCGEDCYCGIPVRPFQPEGSCASYGRKRYAMFLYKIYNGLQARWDPQEINGTLHMLRNELLRVEPALCQVPPRFPDTSGIKVAQPRSVSYDEPWWEPVLDEVDSGDVRDPYVMGFGFKHLLESASPDRPVRSLRIIYWDTLRNNFVANLDFVKSSKRLFPYCNLGEFLNSEYDPQPDPIYWVWKKVVQKGKQGNSRHVRLLRPFGVYRGTTSVSRLTSSTSMWD